MQGRGRGVEEKMCQSGSRVKLHHDKASLMGYQFEKPAFFLGVCRDANDGANTEAYS